MHRRFTNDRAGSLYSRARTLDFFTLDNDILDVFGNRIGPDGIAVYAALVRLTQMHLPTGFTLKDVSLLMGMTVGMVKYAAEKLEKDGLIRKFSEVETDELGTWCIDILDVSK